MKFASISRSRSRAASASSFVSTILDNGNLTLNQTSGSIVLNLLVSGSGSVTKSGAE